MTKEEKSLLLLKDLCARLPYAPKGVYSLKCDSMHPITFDHLTTRYIDRFTTEQSSYTDEIIDIKLYLRPMSSMTKDEKEWYYLYGTSCTTCAASCAELVIDWLNKYHFDYRGLIPMDLALEASEDMYK